MSDRRQNAREQGELWPHRAEAGGREGGEEGEGSGAGSMGEHILRTRLGIFSEGCREVILWDVWPEVTTTEVYINCCIFWFGNFIPFSGCTHIPWVSDFLGCTVSSSFGTVLNKHTRAEVKCCYLTNLLWPLEQRPSQAGQQGGSAALGEHTVTLCCFCVMAVTAAIDALCLQQIK